MYVQSGMAINKFDPDELLLLDSMHTHTNDHIVLGGETVPQLNLHSHTHAHYFLPL